MCSNYGILPACLNHDVTVGRFEALLVIGIDGLLYNYDHYISPALTSQVYGCTIWGSEFKLKVVIQLFNHAPQLVFDKIS